METPRPWGETSHPNHNSGSKILSAEDYAHATRCVNALAKIGNTTPADFIKTAFVNAERSERREDLLRMAKRKLLSFRKLLNSPAEIVTICDEAADVESYKTNVQELIDLITTELPISNSVPEKK